jgi:hypothetical protein
MISWIHFRNARMIQHTQIKEFTTIHKQDKGQNSYHFFNGCGKSLWQNSISLHEKNSEIIRNRRNIPDHGKHIANIILNGERLKILLWSQEWWDNDSILWTKILRWSNKARETSKWDTNRKWRDQIIPFLSYTLKTSPKNI